MKAGTGFTLKQDRDKKPIRVLQCVAGMNRGGYENLIMNVYRNIDRREVQFDFLSSLDGSFDDEILALGGKIHKVPFITKVGPFSYSRAVRNVFQSGDYEIVHSHMDKFSGLIAREAKRCEIPIRIAHSHSVSNEGNFAYRAVKDYYGRFIPCATDYFACSEKAAAWMYGANGSKATIIKNGIDLDRYTLTDNRAEGFTIGQVGRFNKVKNQQFTIKVFEKVVKRCDNARLLFAGDGDLKEEAKQLASSLGLSDRVEFCGEVSDIAAFLSRLDVICMPSLHEGIPLSLIEAQASGVPCAVSDNIDRSVDISKEIEFISLTSATDVWANALLKNKGNKRYDCKERLCEEGYDIKKTALFLQEKYLKMQDSLKEGKQNGRTL